MSTITATNNATVSTQSLMSQTQLQEARQEADQAESNAKQLRKRADQAEQDAQKSRQTVQYLSAQLLQQNANTYAQTPATNSSPVTPQVQNFLVNMYNASSAQFAASGNPLKTDAAAAPVLNTQGQATGRIVNLAV